MACLYLDMTHLSSADADVTIQCAMFFQPFTTFFDISVLAKEKSDAFISTSTILDILCNGSSFLIASSSSSSSSPTAIIHHGMV